MKDLGLSLMVSWNFITSVVGAYVIGSWLGAAFVNAFVR